MSRRRGDRRLNGPTPPGGSRLSVTSSAHLRAELLALHPDCAGPRRRGLVPLAQAVCEWPTPETARILAECATPEGLARNVARRSAAKPSGLALEMRWEDMRRESRLRAEALEAQWAVDDAAKAAAEKAKRSAA